MRRRTSLAVALIAATVTPASATVARADETRAIVDAATTYFARREFTALAYSHASVARAGDFAIFSALSGVVSGDAILRRQAGRWHVVFNAKGMFGEDLFVSAGASLDEAERLTIPCPPRAGEEAVEPTPRAIRTDGAGYVVTTALRHVVRVTTRTVVVPARRVRFETVDPPVVKIVPRTVVTVCE